MLHAIVNRTGSDYAHVISSEGWWAMRIRNRGLLVGLAVSALVAGHAATAPAQSLVEPRVIGGSPGHPWSAASVAWETSDGECTGALWRPRIVITAAHCIVSDDGAVVPANDITLWAPGGNKEAPPSPVKVTNVIVDATYRYDQAEATGDVAFLILNAPLGTPLITRIATPTEVEVLAGLETPVTYIGYGLTGSSEDVNSSSSAIPLSLVPTLIETYPADRSFEMVSAPNAGICNGDSGGPFVAQVGDELLYLGPLSGAEGPPCHPSDGGDRQLVDASIVSMETGLLAAALAAAGEPADVVPTTCIQGPDVDRECNPGRAWIYSYCWSGRRAVLQEQVENTWVRLARTTGPRSSECERSSPFDITFLGLGHDGASRYRIVLPQQKGLPRGSKDVFTVRTS